MPTYDDDEIRAGLMRLGMDMRGKFTPDRIREDWRGMSNCYPPKMTQNLINAYRPDQSAEDYWIDRWHQETNRVEKLHARLESLKGWLSIAVALAVTGWLLVWWGTR